MIDFSKFEAITFDCYGTLIDWEAGILSAFRAAFESVGIHPSDEEILAAYADAEALQEAPPYRRYRQVLAGCTFSVAQKFGAQNLSGSDLNFLSNSLASWKPFDDTVEALKKLGKRFKLGVVSNVDRELFKATNLSMGSPFHWIMTAEDVRAYKPSHQNFLEMEKLMGIPRERWLHAAQSLFHDVSPCNALGITSVWIDRRAGRDSQGAVKGSDAKPDATFKSLREFAEAACGAVIT